MNCYNYQILGGQLLNVKFSGKELFYLSPYSHPSQKSSRGGVPVIFPQFADRGPLRKHGWARELPWTLLHEERDPQCSVLAMQLVLGYGHDTNWPYSAKITISTKIHISSLEMALTIKNTGEDTFSWTGGLHPYWATTDLLGSKIYGLAGVRVYDRYEPSKTREANHPISWTGSEYECLYDSQQPVLLKTPSHSLKLSMIGFDQWMVWNPGKNGSLSIQDLPDKDWQHFICIEPVLVSRPCSLGPGDVFEGALYVDIL